MLALGFGYQAFSMNGFAVSVSNGRGSNLSALNSGWPYQGPIVKYTIENDTVKSCDTIYKEYWGAWPILNVQGTKIAFDRLSTKGGSDTLQDNVKFRYLSVMDSDGKNRYDLDTMPRFCKKVFIAWPAGDYIYYHKSRYCQYGDADWASGGKPASEIYRVKYNDPSTRTLIFTYKQIQTFSVSLDGKRAGVTSLYDNEFKNLPHAFPPTSEPVKDGWDSKVWVGCGSYVSPSGKYHHHFFGGGHTDLRINTWDLPKVLIATVDFNFTNDFAAWSGMPLDSIANGGPMEWGRWAANSDKWITSSGANKLGTDANGLPIGGSNQLLLNWIDHKTINTSRNSRRAPDGFIYRSDPGALWVAGGPGGETYENVNGDWVDLNGTVVQHGTVQLRRDLSRIDFGREPLSQKVNVYTLQGKSLGALDRGAISTALPAGTYFTASGMGNGTMKISVGENEVQR
jgi:hypothetical protein